MLSTFLIFHKLFLGSFCERNHSFYLIIAVVILFPENVSQLVDVDNLVANRLIQVDHQLCIVPLSPVSNKGSLQNSFLSMLFRRFE